MAALVRKLGKTCLFVGLFLVSMRETLAAVSGNDITQTSTRGHALTASQGEPGARLHRRVS